MSDYIDVVALGKLLVASLIGGVGLVALFALAVRGLSRATDENGVDGAVVAAVSLSVVVVGVVGGLYVLRSA